MNKTTARLLSLFLALAVFYFFGRALYGNWQQIKGYDLNFDVGTLLLASLIYAVSMGLLGFGWHIILRYVHYPIPLLYTLLYFFITQPAKYIPGKVWIGVTRMKLCKPHGVPNSVTFLTSGIEGVIEVFAAAYVAILFGISHAQRFGEHSGVWIIGLSLMGLVLLIPRVFYHLINLYLKTVKHNPVPRDKWVSFSKLLSLQLIYIVGLFCFGFSHIIFLNAFAPIDGAHFSRIMSIAMFSYIASVLAFFSPSGLGVREGIWYIALKKIAPIHISLIFSIVSRAWTVIVEALLLMISLPVLWIARKYYHTDHRLPEPDVKSV